MIPVAWAAQRLDPVCVVVLILDHSTDVYELKRALIQQSMRLSWNMFDIKQNGILIKVKILNIHTKIEGAHIYL